MMSHLGALVEDGSLQGQTVTANSGQSYVVDAMDDFSYTDPVDKSITTKQACPEADVCWYLLLASRNVDYNYGWINA